MLNLNEIIALNLPVLLGNENQPLSREQLEDKYLS